MSAARTSTQESIVRAARRRRAQRGFTLTELTVSLLGGLIIAMAVVGLSREANNTFHEEIRTAAAESGLRTALDRLRSDLQRAAFMATGNVTRDPQIAALPGQSHISATAKAAYPELAKLAGIRINVGGSAAATPLSAAQNPTLNPDAIDIAGNLTSSDQFIILGIDNSPTGCGQRLWLQTDTPSMWRILATQNGADGGTAGAADQALLNAFQPVAGARAIVRLQDAKGMYQYLVTCPTAAGGASAGAPTPWIDIDKNTPILTSKDTGGFGGADGLCNGCIVNPVQMVRWEIKPSGVAALNPSGDANKYDLMRSFVDITSGNVIASSSEVIAEYAVDLKFALTVDSNVANTTGIGPTLTTLAFDDDTTNAQWANDVSALPVFGTAWTNATAAPQRIRAVRVRLVTRSAISDRSTNVTVPALTPTPSITQRYLFRYCAGPVTASDGGVGLPDCTQAAPIWARARTVTTEVWLTNQAGMFYL